MHIINSKLNIQGTNQQHLATVLKSLFTEYHIITNARKEGDVRVPLAFENSHPEPNQMPYSKQNGVGQSPTVTPIYSPLESPTNDLEHISNLLSGSGGHYLELDFWIPALRLAFEYQDPHHYISTFYANASIPSIQNNDKIKRAIMKERGDNLVIVPCWWQGDVDSLVTTIRNERSDLLTDRPIISAPIPPTPPIGYFKAIGIPDIGELMVPSFPRVAQFNVAGWWINEKYDGIRICWHGARRNLYSRYGRLIFLPESLSRTFPGIFFDGEAWAGREGFNEVQTIMSQTYDPQSWDLFRVPIFDTPDPKLALLDFEQRALEIHPLVPPDHPVLMFASNMKCQTAADLPKLVLLVLQHGGEGVIARKAASRYLSGLSDVLWKFKASRDMDALVIDEDEGDGTLLLKLPNNVVFKSKMISSGITAPTTGKVVSLSYSKYSPTLGPINSKIERVREDVEWDEVVGNAYQNFTQDRAPVVQQHNLKARLSAGYWTEQENVRQFFDDIARKHNFDPGDTLSWYSYSIRDIVSEGGGSMLARYSQSPLRALRVAYPNLDFVPHMFSTVPKNYWTSPDNRRQFLLDFAHQKGFDASVPSHWYNVTVQEVLDVKGGAMVLLHHDRSLSNALCDLLPNIGLERNRFKAPRGYFTSTLNQRNFFESFAHRTGFNPLASGWRSVTKADILLEPGGPTMINKYKTLPGALSTLFPELDNNAFRSFNPKKYWNDEGNRRQYFETIAKKGKFNPLVPEGWYSVPLHTYVKLKGYKSILNYYKVRSIVSALNRCYPNIGLDSSKFKRTIIHHYRP